jgi:NAD(P)-dependent dehydrogenase (short-subunit alcohol dehydrogenase family)
LRDKVVVVTGGNSGIGYTASLRFVKMGAKVIIASRDKDKGEKAVNTINKITRSDRAVFLQLDLNALSNVETFVESFKDLKTGRLDILVNNAGLATKDGDKTKEVCQSYIEDELIIVGIRMWFWSDDVRTLLFDEIIVAIYDELS